MGSITTKHPQGRQPPGIDIEAWLDRLRPTRSEKEIEVIRAACQFAEQAHEGQTRASGEPFIHHAVAVADILTDLRLDHETIAAAILHDVVEDTRVTLRDVEQVFGPMIASLVNGVTKMAMIHGLPGEAGGKSRESARAESLRKMLLAMAEDVRVVLIKLADRLHNMRTLSSLPAHKQQRIARETMDLFAPLANRLGIWRIKWELEDLSFRYLRPDAYKQIAAALAERRVDRERYISQFVSDLQSELQEIGIHAEVTGRAKHIYSIWRKMQRKQQDFNQIRDIRAVRVLVDTLPECYGALGVVHTEWQYLPGEFDDYIATPKENNYRSIHTAVIGPDGKIVEVQIRTHKMHRQSELGVAAHWRYKEGTKTDTAFNEKIAWLRQLLEWKDEVAEASDFVDQFKSEVFSDRVYVFTPRGNVLDLPRGATPLDFAYHIHTEVGHRCRGAKVNGHIVPLTYALKTGEQVEILTVKRGGPSRDWLNRDLGYLKTSKARSHVQRWFRQQNYEHNIADGRTGLERELKRLGFVNVNQEKLAQQFGFDKADQLFGAIGRGDLKASRVINAIQDHVRAQPSTAPSLPAVAEGRRAEASSAIRVQGVGNLLTRMAGCCKPVPGDPIVGFITRGHGVTVHRRDCHMTLRYSNESPERLVEVDWGDGAEGAYPVEVQIEAYDRQGLLRDITTVLADAKINVLAVNTLSNRSQHTVSMVITLEVPDIDTLRRILAKINQLPNVTEVRRKTQ